MKISTNFLNKIAFFICMSALAVSFVACTGGQNDATAKQSENRVTNQVDWDTRWKQIVSDNNQKNIQR